MRTLPGLPLPFDVEHLYDADRAGGFVVVHRERRRVLARRDDGVMLWAYLRHGRSVVRTEVVTGGAARALFEEMLRKKRRGPDHAPAAPRAAPNTGALDWERGLAVWLLHTTQDAAREAEKRCWHPDVGTTQRLATRERLVALVDEAIAGDADVLVTDLAFGERDVTVLDGIARRCASGGTVFVCRAAPSLAGESHYGEARGADHTRAVFESRSHERWSALRDVPHSRYLCVSWRPTSCALAAVHDAWVFDLWAGEARFGDASPGDTHTESALDAHGVAFDRLVSPVRPRVFRAPGDERHANHHVVATLFANQLHRGLQRACVPEADVRVWLGELVNLAAGAVARARYDAGELALLLPRGDDFCWVTLARDATPAAPAETPTGASAPSPRVTDSDRGLPALRRRWLPLALGPSATPLLDERVLVRLPAQAEVLPWLSRPGHLWRVDDPAPSSWSLCEQAFDAGATAELAVARVSSGDVVLFVVAAEHPSWDLHEDDPIRQRLGDVVATREIGDLRLSVTSPSPGRPDWVAHFAAHLLDSAELGIRSRPSARVRFAVPKDRVAQMAVAAEHVATVLREEDVVACEIRGSGAMHSRLTVHVLNSADLRLPYVSPEHFDDGVVLGAPRRFRKDVQRGRVVRDVTVALEDNRVLYAVSEVEGDWTVHQDMLQSLRLSTAAPATLTVPAAWPDLYDVEARLGRGGAAEVHRVRHRGWAMDLAMKRPRPDAGALADTLNDEAEAWTKLGPHPNVVSCYQARKRDGVPHIFVELVEGGSLAEWIGDGRLYEAVFDASRYSSPETHRRAAVYARILDIGIQVAFGLHHAHEHGLIHQDVKPANVMLTPEGVAKVTDFGLVRASRSPHEVEVGNTVVATFGGLTPAYCSPEQATAASTGDKLTRRTDVWSWAVMMLEMFNGAVTWRSGALARVVLDELVAHGATSELAPPLPEELRELLDTCLQVRPDDRPHDMLEVATALSRIHHQNLGNRYPRRPPRSVDGRADVLANRGASLMDLNRTSDAVEAWSGALEVEPLHLEAGYNLALYLHRQGGVHLQARMRDIAHAHPKRWQAMHALAWSHVEGGDRAAAEMAIDQARVAGAPRRVVTRVRDTVVAGLLAVATQRIAAPTALAFDGGQVFGCRSVGERRTRVFLWNVDENAVAGVEIDLAATALHVVGDSIWVLGKRWRQHRGALEARDEAWRLQRHDLTTVRQRDLGSWGDSDVPQCFSVAGDTLWLGRQSGAVEIFRISDQTLQHRSAVHDGPVVAIDMVRDDPNDVVTVGTDGRAVRWQGSERRVVGVYACRAAVSLHAAEGHLTVAEAGGILRIDLASRRRVRIPAGRDVALGDQRAVEHRGGGALRLWDLDRRRITHDATPRAAHVVAHATDGQHVVAAYEDGVAVVYRVVSTAKAPWLVVRPRSSEQLLADEVAHADALTVANEALDRGEIDVARRVAAQGVGVAGYARSAALLALRRRVASVTKRGTARGRWLRHVVSTTPWVACSMSGDGSLALCLDGHGQVALWRLPTDARRRAELDDTLHEQAWVEHVALSMDGAHALTRSAQDVAAWDLRSGRRVSLGMCAACALSPDGMRVVLAAPELCVWDWRTDTRRVLASDEPTRVAISGAGTHVAAALSDGLLVRWDVPTGRRVWQRGGHHERVTALAIDDAGVVVSAGPEGVFRWASAACPESLGSMCAQRVVAASGLVGVCDPPRPACIVDVLGIAHELDAARDIAISSDGETVLTCSESGLRVWELDWERT